jgi:hypothetical protein
MYAVDRFFDDILGSAEKVNHLIAFTPEDAEIVAQIGYPPERDSIFLFSLSSTSSVDGTSHTRPVICAMYEYIVQLVN